jgi:hypothetical protein
MTFFFVLGLEARRELDLGELRERRRFALPLLAAIGGMAVAVTIYLLLNAGSSSARGWGIAMSTDTAFALGLLAFVGPRLPDRLRAFMLTAVVFDDLVALVVIASAYTETLRVVPLVVAVGCYTGVLVVARRARFGAPCGVFASGRGRMGGAAGVWRGAGRDRSRDGPAGLRLPGVAVEPGTRHGALPASFGSSRPPSWHGWLVWSSGRRRRSTSACNSASTRGRAT